MKTEMMQKKSLDWSPYQYLLVANPTSDVCNKVMAEKQVFYEQFGEATTKTKPHITVANFVAKEEMEETIIRYMQRIFIQHTAFEVALNNYSAFPPHTIYLRVQNQQPFNQLAKELKAVSDYISSCSCPEVKITSKPHVSIAKRLTEPVYTKAIMDYSQKNFHETFVVNELVLLKRSNEYDTCKTVHVFRLQPSNQTSRNALFN